MNPTLSILIPTYNWNIRQLLEALGSEITDGDLIADVEIFFIDDCSTDSAVVEANINAARLWQGKGVKVTYLQNEDNLGRSATRNMLVAASTGSFLLFLDADVIPDAASFIAGYLKACRDGVQVACGGVSYRQCDHFDKKFSFYVKYSGQVSVASAVARNAKPWAWVFTANMMTSRDVFNRVPFDETFHGYGYEDLEWGIRLSSLCGIVHLDNTVTHLGLLTKQILHKKMVASVQNLVRLCELHPSLASELALVRVANSFSVLPFSLLDRMSRFCGWMFIKINCLYPVELTMLQGGKVLSAAAIFKSTVRRSL